jgi:hypothetical protein
MHRIIVNRGYLTLAQGELTLAAAQKTVRKQSSKFRRRDSSLYVQIVIILQIRFSPSLKHRFLGIISAKFVTEERASWSAPQLRDTVLDRKCASAECAAGSCIGLSAASIHDIPPSMM